MQISLEDAAKSLTPVYFCLNPEAAVENTRRHHLYLFYRATFGITDNKVKCVDPPKPVFSSTNESIFNEIIFCDFDKLEYFNTIVGALEHQITKVKQEGEKMSNSVKSTESMKQEREKMSNAVKSTESMNSEKLLTFSILVRGQYLQFTSTSNSAFLEVLLPSGLRLSGTASHLCSALTRLGYPITSLDTYFSESKGYNIPIASMDSAHIRNAIVKNVREYVGLLKAHKLTNQELVTELMNLATVGYKGTDKLVNELNKRGND